MGILNFNNLIRKYCGESSIIQLGYLKRKEELKIAIDTSNYMYKFKGKATKIIISTTKFKYMNDEWSDINEKQVLTKWLEIFLDLVIEMRKNNIRPIFVLDGNAPCEKISTQNIRKDKIQLSTDKVTLCKKNKNELEKYKRSICNNIQIKNYDKKLLIQFLKYINCDVIQATGEAEQLCCQLCKNNIVFGVLSSDTDLYAYGCPIIINDINLYNFYKSPTITITFLNNVLNILNLTYEQMVLLCILSGNDYNDNVYGYGVLKCYNIIKKYSIFKQSTSDTKYIDCNLSIKNNKISINLFPTTYHNYHYIYNKNYNSNLQLDYHATMSNIINNNDKFKDLNYNDSLELFTTNKNFICNDIINNSDDNKFDIDEYFDHYLDINYKQKILNKIKILSSLLIDYNDDNNNKNNIIDDNIDYHNDDNNNNNIIDDNIDYHNIDNHIDDDFDDNDDIDDIDNIDNIDNDDIDNIDNDNDIDDHIDNNNDININHNDINMHKSIYNNKHNIVSYV
jgi:5'-3' exonuclease